jgi:hypothetical protein
MTVPASEAASALGGRVYVVSSASSPSPVAVSLSRPLPHHTLPLLPRSLQDRGIGTFSTAVCEGDDVDEEWSVDTSAKAVAERLKMQEAAYNKVEAAAVAVSEKRAADAGDGWDGLEEQKRQIGAEVKEALEGAEEEADGDEKAKVRDPAATHAHLSSSFSACTRAGPV